MRPNNDTDRRHQVNLALMRLCFGSLAVRLNRRIHGFASQPRDWFAFVGRETSLTERRAREGRQQGPCRACPHANYVIAKGPPAGCPRAADQLLVARASVTDQMLASDGASPRVRQLGRCDGPRRSSSPGRRAAAASWGRPQPPRARIALESAHRLTAIHAGKRHGRASRGGHARDGPRRRSRGRRRVRAEHAARIIARLRTSYSAARGCHTPPRRGRAGRTGRLSASTTGSVRDV